MLAIQATLALQAGSAPERRDAERGVALYRAGDYDGARVALERAVAQAPSDLRAWQDLGWTLHRLGQTNQAIRVWQDILVADPAFIRAHNAMGYVLQQKGEPRRAAVHYGHSLKARKDQVNVWVRLGESLEATHRFDHAAGAYRAALRRQPDNESAALHLARLLGRQNKWEEAASLLRKFKETNPESSQAVDYGLARIEAARGVAAYRAEDFDGAALQFAKACDLHPDKPRYAIDRGWALRGAGRTGEALEAWKHAAKLQPADPWALHLAIADAAQELGNTEDARLHYETALTERGNDPQILYRYALMELEAEHAQAALPLMRRALQDTNLDASWGRRFANALIGYGVPAAGTGMFEQSNAGHPGAATAAGLAILYHHAGVQAYQDKQHDKAIASFRDALALAPASEPVLRDLGWAYWRAGELAACGRTWRQLAQSHPDFAVAHDLLAQYHLRLGDYEAAAQAARTCLSKDPDYTAARKHLARALVDSGRPGEARKLLHALSREYPDDGGLQQLYGLALTKLLDYEAAEPQWRRVLRILPDSAIAQQNWIDALYRVGKRAQALEAARRFAEGTDTPAAILELLAHDALRSEDYAEAERWFNRLTDMQPERPGYWLKVSECLAAREEHQLRPSLLRAAAGIRPDRADLQLELCAALADAGQPAESIRAFAAFLREFPYSYLGFDAYLDTLRRFGRHQEALRVLEQNRSMFYQLHEAAFRRADLLRMLKRYGEADAVLDAAAKDDDRYADVPILVYHGLSEHEDSADMPVANFDDQLAALRERGFTPLTVTELDDAVRRKGVLPTRPIVITFDDARTESFALADPVLQRHGMKATMFVPTSRITEEDLYHASRSSLRRYAATGRWELQSHGHEAHNWITATSGGHAGSFLGCRIWLTSEERHETEDEFRGRLQGDYRESAKQVRELVTAGPARGYAFPYSDFGQSARAGAYELAPVNIELVNEVFGFGFIQRPSGYNRLQLRQPLPPLLRRFTVPYEWSGKDLVEFLAADRPVNKALLEKAKGAAWEGRYETAARLYRDLKRRERALAARCDRALADLAVARGRGTEALSILEQRGDSIPLDDSTRYRLDWLTQPIVAATGGYHADSEGRLLQRAGLQGRWPLFHDVSLSIRAGTILMEENGLGDAPGYEMDCGLVAPLPWRWQLHADAGLSALEGAEDSVTGGVAFRKRLDLHDVTIQWGYRDIDTLRARQAGIDFRRFSAAYVFHSVAWPSAIRLMRWEISDGNTRSDVRCRLFHRFSAFPDWQIGGTLEYADVDFQTPDYYTPEQLFAPRAAVRYDYRKTDTWSAGLEAGIGSVSDENNEDRLTARGTLRVTKEWGARTRLGLSGYYSTTAGYTASGAEANLQYLF